MYTEEQINEWKIKSEKWDDLEEKVALCHGIWNAEGEWEELDDDDIDLYAIGKITKEAFE